MPGSASKKVLTPGTTAHRGEPEALSLKMRKGFFASMLSFLSFSKRFEPMVARITRFSSVVPWENQNLALFAEQKQLARRFDPIRGFELVETFPELCLFLHKGAALTRKLFLGDEFLAAQAGQVIETLDARRKRLLCGSFDFCVIALLRLLAHHRERFLQLVTVEIDSVDEFQNLAVQ